MNLRKALSVAILGLGTVAGAVFPVVVRAQVPVKRDTVPVSRDTVRIPLPARLDTIPGKPDSVVTKSVVPLPVKSDTTKPDTIKAPLAHAEAPVIIETGVPRVYDRAAMFATGALTISEFLSRVPGLTEYSAGSIFVSPTVVASQGNLKAIRIFLDGIELDPLDRRSRGTAPINDLPIHALEEIRIERGADQVRVYARSWRVDRTTSYTRADVGTGDQNSNLYRAWFGRRYDGGEVLQVGAEQGSVQPDRALASSNETNIMARVGASHGPWNVDGFMQTAHVIRGPWTGSGFRSDVQDTVPNIETQRSTSYLRFANGDPDNGRWFQLLASAESYSAKPPTSSNVTFVTPTVPDTTTAIPDSTGYESQYLITGGVTRGPFAVSAAERVRVGDHRTSHVLSGRAASTTGPLSVSLFGEGRSFTEPARIEGTARLNLFDRVSLLATQSRTGSGDFDRMFVETRSGAVLGENGLLLSSGGVPLIGDDSTEITRYHLLATTNSRADASLRLRDMWFSVGMLSRGATTLFAPAIFDSAYATQAAVRTEGAATAKTAGVRGRLWRGVNVDAWGVAWNDSTGLYRPRYQTRSELYIQTNLLDRFPHGNFGLLTSLVHEYRSSSRFPVGTDSVRTAPGFRALSFKLEIRIQTAVVSYQFRNVLQEAYSQVPGYNFPRQTQFYGVRWEFWN